MDKHTPTVRHLDTVHPGIHVCIVCGSASPTTSVIVQPDPQPADQFHPYAASAHLDCFLACPIVPRSEVP